MSNYCLPVGTNKPSQLPHTLKQNVHARRLTKRSINKSFFWKKILPTVIDKIYVCCIFRRRIFFHYICLCYVSTLPWSKRLHLCCLPFRPYGCSCSYFASRSAEISYQDISLNKTLQCRDLWTIYELNGNQITSIGLMISNKLLLATRIDNKTIHGAYIGTLGLMEWK